MINYITKIFVTCKQTFSRKAERWKREYKSKIRRLVYCSNLLEYNCSLCLSISQ